jgi:signal transduction histidine kinase
VGNPAESGRRDGLDGCIPEGVAPLESILCTEELYRRPSRAPDYETENRALVALAQALADSPRTILQTLADTILDVFRADSAGVSLLTKEDGGKRFFWPAIAGKWKPYIGGGTPRNFGPCGDVLDRNSPLLMQHVERRYPYFQPVAPPVEECLLVPFYVKSKAVGTIWAVAHDERRKFDAEDQRLMRSLGTFASSAYQILALLESLSNEIVERTQAQDDLGRTYDSLEIRVAERTAELSKANEDIRAISAQMQRAEDEERRRLGRELHDSAGQLLAAIKMNLAAVLEMPLSTEVSRSISDSSNLVDQVIREIRTVSYLLHPPLLEMVGLASALRFYIDGFAERSRLAVEVDIPQDFDRLNQSIEIALFRVAQECLTNIHRHSGSSTAAVRITQAGGVIEMQVKDTGKGIPAEKQVALNASGGVGFRGMRERISRLGGSFEVQSDANGTVVTTRVPVPTATVAANEGAPAA